MGYYEKHTPVRAWNSLPLAFLDRAHSPFRPPPPGLLAHTFPQECEAAIVAGDRILNGEMCYFSHYWLPRPSNWRTNPQNGHSTSIAHWATFAEFIPEQDDIKWIWEASRFDWAYILGRAWAYTGNDTYTSLFWKFLEEWREHNPPNQSINWKCGQECSLRLLALVWAAGVFPATSSQTTLLWEVVARLAERIALSLDYALAQNNNHAISEASALYVAGNCLPSHPRAIRWKKIGQSLLARLVLRQFAPDGSYVQHSHNYTRLAMRGIFCSLFCAPEGEALPAQIQERLEAAVTLLYTAQALSTGRVPNYGANDGANIMALSGCDYLDYRPIMNLLRYQSARVRLYEHGSWDEELVWHFGAIALQSPISPGHQESQSYSDGGYYTLRQKKATVTIRCHSYRTRPAHADALHLDYWYDDQPILIDAGTFSYNVPKAWYDYFSGTESHNTVTIDGHDQMPRASRFLWRDWVQARLNAFDASTFEGEHSSYAPVIHQRRVRLIGEVCVVCDTLIGAQKTHLFRLHWLLEDVPLDILEADSGTRIRLPGQEESLLLLTAEANSATVTWRWSRAESEPPRGWQSLYYGERTPAWCLEGTVAAAGDVRFVTFIGPEADVLKLRHATQTNPALIWAN